MLALLIIPVIIILVLTIIFLMVQNAQDSKEILTLRAEILHLKDELSRHANGRYYGEDDEDEG